MLKFKNVKNLSKWKKYNFRFNEFGSLVKESACIQIVCNIYIINIYT